MLLILGYVLVFFGILLTLLSMRARAEEKMGLATLINLAIFLIVLGVIIVGDESCTREKEMVKREALGTPISLDDLEIGSSYQVEGIVLGDDESAHLTLRSLAKDDSKPIILLRLEKLPTNLVTGDEITKTNNGLVIIKQ